MRSFLLALVAVLVAAVPAHADPVINLGSIIPNGINGHRQIVGDSFDPNNDDAPTHADDLELGRALAAGRAGGHDRERRVRDQRRRAHRGWVDLERAASRALLGRGRPARRISSGRSRPGRRTSARPTRVDNAGDVVGNTLDANSAAIGFFSPRGSGITEVGDGLGGPFTHAPIAGITPDGQTMLGHVNGDTDHQSATGWYLFNSPGDAGTQLDLNLFQTGASILGAAASPQYANLMASDGTVLGYKGANASTGPFYLRLPNGARDAGQRADRAQRRQRQAHGDRHDPGHLPGPAGPARGDLEAGRHGRRPQLAAARRTPTTSSATRSRSTTTATSSASRARSRRRRRSGSCCPRASSSTASSTTPTRRRATATA